MKSYKVIYQKKADKWMLKNPYSIKFHKAFSEISKDIHEGFKVYDIKKMSGKSNFFRLRIGDYRAIFTIENEILIIIVINIGSRGQIYKKRDL